MSHAPVDAPLAGIGVLVTRPQHQAERLCTLFADAGATPIRFPAITIAAPTDPTAADAVIDAMRAIAAGPSTAELICR